MLSNTLTFQSALCEANKMDTVLEICQKSQLIPLWLYRSPICHCSHNAPNARNFRQLFYNELKAKNNKATLKLTFSCHPSSTLPLISPHPGIAIPLYRYFISVSCESCERDLITPVISVAFVVLRMVSSVCRVSTWKAAGSRQSQGSAAQRSAPSPHPRWVHTVRCQV